MILTTTRKILTAMVGVLLIATATPAATPTPASTAIAPSRIDALYFESSPSSWIGQGQTVNVSGAPGSMGYHRYFQQGAYTNSIHFSFGGWNLAFVGDNQSIPQVGFYDAATRWPFMNNGAGLNLSGYGRGNNRLSGFFEVFEANYATNGQLISFAADFTQYDEQNIGRWNTGSIRYNSSVPIPVPEPSTWAVLGTLTLGLYGWAIKAKRVPLGQERS